MKLSKEDKWIIGIITASAIAFWALKKVGSPVLIGAVSGPKMDLSKHVEKGMITARLMNILREFTRDHYDHTDREKQDEWALKTVRKNFTYPKKIEKNVAASLLLFCYNGEGPFGKMVK